MREEGQGDTATPTLSLRRAADQHESWGGSHGCWGGDKEGLTLESRECWPGNANQVLLSVL